jgi:adenosylcobinamide-GDP ribazoletransferase
MMPSLILAIRFLTIVPVPGREAEGRGALGRAAWWFPAVGLGLGAVLVALDRALVLAFPPLLTALLVLACWKVATGGIHLDGLADCLDGLGGRDPRHRLAIMRDSRIGTFGAIGLILYFLSALLALAEMPLAARDRLLLLAPAAGRLAPLLIAPRFGSASPGRGTGSAFVQHVGDWAGPVNLIAVLGLGAWLLGPWGPALIVGALVIAFLWSASLAWWFGGLTGDALGSGVELGELAILLAGAALAHRGLI